jgi:tetratricopeptide (TPR) repeat protein
VGGLSDVPSEQLVLLRPHATQEVPLNVVLSDRVLEQRGDRPAQLVVAASYESMRLPRTETASAQLVAYGPGAIDWSRGVAQAAAYVTTRDPVVGDLGREVSRLVALEPEEAFANRNLATAAGLVEALGVLGLAYVPDPNNPFAVMSETPHAIDTVHYPRETLVSRAGDCDDSTVLVAALLGSVGIESAFVDVPQHLFVLADAGLHARHRSAFGVDEELLAVHDERVWIPIETTAIGRGFAAAWEEGARRYREYADRGLLEIVEVGAAQRRYPPAEPPGGVRVPVVDAGLVRERLSRAGAEVAAWRETHLATRYGGARSGLAPSPAALEEVAQVYFVAGRFAEARSRLEEALALAPASAAAHNNLALACTAAGDLDSARTHLEAAVRAEPSDGGVWLNLGLVRHVSGDSAGAVAACREGVERSGGWVAACKLLGLDPGDDARRAQGASLTPEEARELLRRALEKVPSPAAGSDVTSGATAAADTTATSSQTARPPSEARNRVGAPRGGRDIEIHRVMYWKEFSG